MMLALTSLNFPKSTHKALIVQAEVEIKNVAGLDERAAAKFTQLASSYRCRVWLNYQKKRRDGKDILGILMLQIKKGAMITLEIEGENEEECFNALKALVDNKFGYKE
jgi:phosphocarrier protein